jgi:uncharacterized membrane protein
MDIQDLFAETSRLSPEPGRPGGGVGDVLDAARHSAVSELVRILGMGLARVEALGFSMTLALPVDPGMTLCRVVAPAGASTAAESLAQGEVALIDVSVEVAGENGNIGTVVLSFAIER